MNSSQLVGKTAEADASRLTFVQQRPMRRQEQAANHIACRKDVECGAGLVKRIARRMKARLPASVELDDIIQAGMVGLLDAIERYEQTRGAQFQTYAEQRIRGAMLDELRSSDWLPRSARRNMRRIETAINTLEQRYRRPPSEKEVAEHLKLSLSEYQQMLQDAAGSQIVSYDDFSEDSAFLERRAADTLPEPLESVLDAEMREQLAAAIDDLPEREKLALSLYYERDLNLREIGAILGVSESRVCQLHTQAIARLRATTEELKDVPSHDAARRVIRDRERPTSQLTPL